MVSTFAFLLWKNSILWRNSISTRKNLRWEMAISSKRCRQCRRTQERWLGMHLLIILRSAEFVSISVDFTHAYWDTVSLCKKWIFSGSSVSKLWAWKPVLPCSPHASIGRCHSTRIQDSSNAALHINFRIKLFPVWNLDTDIFYG